MTVGFAVCGSFCTYDRVFPVMAELAKEHTVIPIFSPASYVTDSRFGTAQSNIRKVADICGKDPMYAVSQVEPIGPKKLLDALVIAPCTGNTLAKLNLAITDTAATMAVKSHLRRGRPVVVAPSTNDALKGSAKNIGALLSREHFYFVPFRQDNPKGKPASVVADFSLIPETLTAALAGVQLQPILRMI